METLLEALVALDSADENYSANLSELVESIRVESNNMAEGYNAKVAELSSKISELSDSNEMLKAKNYDLLMAVSGEPVEAEADADTEPIELEDLFE